MVDIKTETLEEAERLKKFWRLRNEYLAEHRDLVAGTYRQKVKSYELLISNEPKALVELSCAIIAGKPALIRFPITNQQEADAVAKEAEAFGVKALPLLADVGNEEQAVSMVEKAAAEFGRIDILVNNAGLRLASPFTELTTEEWRTVLAVNLDGPFFLCRAVVPDMIEAGWGRIINVSGLQAYKGGKDRAHISASKMGALGLTRALAFELAEHSILVNHIVPGAFDTTPAHAQSAQSAIPREQRAAGIPLGRLGMP